MDPDATPADRPAIPRCPECGYDLSGILAAAADPPPQPPRCPECGTAFDPKTVRALPNLPGFLKLVWVCLRPAAAYLGLVLLTGLLITRQPHVLWGGALACLGPPALLATTLGTVVHFTTAHYIAKERWWVIFLMLFGSLSVSAAVAVVCSLGLGAL